VSISVELDDRVADVRVTDEALEVRLRDGRQISTPLAWFPRLLSATAEQRGHWELAAAGHGIHWPEIDEDLSVAGLLRSSEMS
jgi:hypothetical protein